MTPAVLDPRGALALPHVYEGLMSAIGADAGMDRFLCEHLRARTGMRFLDLGCGPGRLLRHLPMMEYCGIDQDARYIQRAQARHPGAWFECGDVAGAAVGTAEFDLAAALGLLHHLSDDKTSRALAFCHARLRPGGRLVTLDCAIEAGQHVVARFLARCDRGRFVRNAPAYRELALEHFGEVRVSVRNDLLRVPYTHAILECVK